MNTAETARSHIAAAFAPVSHAPIGLAVSGGGDSIAMLRLAADWARDTGADLRVVSVHHHLRAEADDELALVAQCCAALTLPHTILHWQWEKCGNLQDAARRARIALIADWAKGHAVPTVALAHTADDMAETFLMRLARQAGVDGLAAMRSRREAEGILWLRPLLAIGRADLRTYLQSIDQPWCDDQSNEDDAYDRARARKLLKTLAPLGIDGDTLRGVAANMADAAEVLRQAASEHAQRIARLEAGDVLFAAADWANTPPELAHRLLSGALRYVSGGDYGPRRAAMAGAQAAIREGRQHSLAGCLIRPHRDTIRITREESAVASLRAAIGMPWDSRWRIDGPAAPDMHVGALGEAGLQRLPEWRAAGLPRTTLAASPAVWSGPNLIAAPLAGAANDYTATLLRDAAHFHGLILSH